MAVGTALKIGSQVIKQAPKLQKFKKLGTLQKILSKVKSSKNVIQKKLNTKQNLAKIGEGLKDLKNINKIRKLNKAISTGTSAARKTPIGKSIARKELSGYLKNYFGGGKPKVLPPNASKFAKLRLGPLSSKIFFGLEAGEALYDDFRWDAPKVRETGNIGTSIMNPIAGGQSDNSITNKLRNLSTNIKHIGNRDKFQRTKLAGSSMLKIDNTPFNPFDDNYSMVPNKAMKHNLRVDRKAKWDAREKRKKEKK
tara:strand:- start:1172 stop:1930 length:759 start_codon:yes stop_codon:yes gene_type:complete